MHVGLLAFVIVPGLLLLWTWRPPFRGAPWPAAVVAGLFGAAQIRDAVANVRAPREWDYGCFWLYAHVARLHANVYDPRAFANVPLPFGVDRDFVASVIDVGFPYPPPTIALVLPFGSIDDVSRGLALWYVAQALAFVVAIVALQRAIFPRDGVRGIVLVGAIALALPALASSTYQAQTNVFLLALVAIALLGRERAWGACVGALAVWVKPYALGLVVADLAARRFRRAAVAAATLVASLAASIALVGTRAFAAYFTSNPASREPASAYTESVNQSLLAVLLRGAGAPLGAHGSILAHPPYLALASACVAAVAYLCVRYRERSDLCFCLSLLLGLVLYPGTLDSYGAVLVVPLLVLWTWRDALPGGAAGVAILTAATVALQGPLHAGFSANALVGAGCAFALVAARRKTAPSV